MENGERTKRHGEGGEFTGKSKKAEILRVKEGEFKGWRDVVKSGRGEETYLEVTYWK